MDLAEVILKDAEAKGYIGVGPKMVDSFAAAVRAHLMSDEAVERAAKAHCDQFGGAGWWETGLIKDTLPVARAAMRSAFSAALGGDGETI